VASTKLRLLLDESVTEPLASYIVTMVPSARLSKHILGQGAEDPAVAKLANRERRTIIAIDSDFSKISVNEGVIKLNHPESTMDDCLFAIFKAFWISGFRSESRKRRTSLNAEGLRIKNGKTIEHQWNPRPCPNRMTRRK
jgi:hypothetical protein